MALENKIAIFNNKSELLKIAKNNFSKSLLLNELEILKKIDPLKIIKVNNENSELSILLSNGTIPDYSKDPWGIIVEIIQKLKKIHSYGISYFNLRTDNVLLIDGEITLVNFIYASEENTIPQYTSIREVKYASPEILSRTTNTISNASDYYSLGIVMYEIFTGSLPFEGSSIGEIIYRQTTETPIQHSKLSRDQWSIISKLLDKNANNRYKTLDGLLYDIEKCKNNIPFIPGAIDRSSYFNIQKKIYGREEEIKELIANYSNKIITISGSSGSGKSTLVNEFIKQINFPIDHFLVGKFEQYEKNKPLSAFLNIFNALMINILKSDEITIRKWRNIFIKKLSINIKMINDLIPLFEKIVGEVPVLQEVTPNENLNRFYSTIVNFIKIIDEELNEAILFLDNMQWADSSSFLLLDNLFQQEFKNLKFILVYRDNEIGELHSFTKLKQKYEKDIFHLQVTNLQKNNVTDLVSDLLYLPAEELDDFIELLYKKTNGNIFYVIKLLQQLYENKNIYFDYEKKKWIITFDSDEPSYQEDLLSLLFSKISYIEDDYKKILQYNSVIGSGTLDFNSKKDIQTLFKSLDMIREDDNAGSLIGKILKLLLEYTGSLISYFVLKEDSKYYIWEGMGKRFFTNETIPLTALNFIDNSRDPLILNDAINSNFSNDSYIQNNKVKSLFVFPIYIEGKLMGILYLENNLISNLYSIEKIEIIQIILAHGKNSILNLLNKNNLQNIIMEKTKEIENKNTKLQDSLEYGKRIQTSLLPKDLPENSFIIWKPKDIVSGDFYWTWNTTNASYIAIADCSGHGVSGALISIIGINLLRKITKEDHITDPDKILFALNNEFIKLVNHTEDHSDGMEIGLLKITENEIFYSGAKRELLMIDPQGELSMLKGNRYEVGGKVLNKVFALHKLEKKEMKLYLYSDGLSSLEVADELLKNAGVRNLLKETSASSIENQKEFLNDFIIKNLRNREQRDDYLIFGLKI